MTQQDKYWKERCEAAEKYIKESPCDPDITVEQIKAYAEWRDLSRTDPPAPAQGVQEENVYPVTPVVFFVRKDGKYVAENGKEVTIDFILKREHALYDEIGYVVLAGSRWQQGQQPAQAIGARWVKALEEIIDPIKFMRERLKEGEQLNGMFAIQMANDANYLRDIAISALKDELPTHFD